MNKKLFFLLILGFIQLFGNSINKKALITAVSRGIGFALAQNLLNREIEIIGISRADKSQLKDLLVNPKFTYI